MAFVQPACTNGVPPIVRVMRSVRSCGLRQGGQRAPHLPRCRSYPSAIRTIEPALIHCVAVTRRAFRVIGIILATLCVLCIRGEGSRFCAWAAPTSRGAERVILFPVEGDAFLGLFQRQIEWHMIGGDRHMTDANPTRTRAVPAGNANTRRDRPGLVWRSRCGARWPRNCRPLSSRSAEIAYRDDGKGSAAHPHTA